MQNELKLSLVFPLNPPRSGVENDFDNLDCVPYGDVNIVDDDELDERDVIEISGLNSRITFYTNSENEFIVLGQIVASVVNSIQAKLSSNTISIHSATSVEALNSIDVDYSNF